jgi:hypothetical protein
MVTKKRFILATLMAWLLFVMLDFLAHASLLKSFWARETAALKSKEELFRLIPLGYLSFFLLVFLIGWLYTRLFKSTESIKTGLYFGAVFGGLFSLSIFLGWYSFLNLPALFLFLASFVYFLEILGVGFAYGYLLPPVSIKKRAWGLAIVIFLGFILGVALQNILP